jgi:hypothetical protein
MLLEVYPFYNTTRVNNGFAIKFRYTGSTSDRKFVFGYRAGQYVSVSAWTGTNGYAYTEHVVSASYDNTNQLLSSDVTLNYPSINTPYTNDTMEQHYTYDWPNTIQRYGINRVDAILCSIQGS